MMMIIMVILLIVVYTEAIFSWLLYFASNGNLIW